MKKFFLMSVTLLIVLCFSSCSKDEEDPAGTITHSINYTAGGMTVRLYQGAADDSNEGNNADYVTIVFGIKDAAMNFCFETIPTNDPNFVDYFGISHWGGEIVDMGRVKGLGSIQEKPASGWTINAAVQEDHGYVARFKHASYYQTANTPYYYARIYVVSFITNNSNGIIGAKIKYQLPF